MDMDGIWQIHTTTILSNLSKLNIKEGTVLDSKVKYLIIIKQKQYVLGVFFGLLTKLASAVLLYDPMA